ncbi:hypothetical protein Spica_1997 [Gracilinema caldarium DSM 7334]|uniref:Uncharacterized protein n=1 Tax=Gracilinema caldarium (strain ATCC 51460 / DSM 7334 / H1) TaxID=744872 RepID=F8EXW1_GRAC1|nr:hypothetical protein Spica_1997 [Gracilinema caldarium DSM 7334]
MLLAGVFYGGLWVYGRSVSLIHVPTELASSLSPWWAGFKKQVVVQGSIEQAPWYLRLSNRDRSFIEVRPFNVERKGLITGNSLFPQKDIQDIYIMDPYVFLVPYQSEGETGLQAITNTMVHTINNKSLADWLAKIYSPGPFVILINGGNDDDFFAFLTVLYSGLSADKGDSLPQLFVQAYETKDPTVLGFAQGSTVTFDLTSPFFSSGPGRVLLTALADLQDAGYMPSQWQYYTQGDLENQMDIVKETMVLFGPYSYKKTNYTTRLLAWRVKLVTDIQGAKPLFPLRLINLSPFGNHILKTDTALFDYMKTKEALRTLNEKTPFLAISFDAPLLNRDHRMFLDSIIRSTVVPCNIGTEKTSTLRAEWLSAFRALLKNQAKK